MTVTLNGENGQLLSDMSSFQWVSKSYRAQVLNLHTVTTTEIGLSLERNENVKFSFTARNSCLKEKSWKRQIVFK